MRLEKLLIRFKLSRLSKKLKTKSFEKESELYKKRVLRQYDLLSEYFRLIN